MAGAVAFAFLGLITTGSKLSLSVAAAAPLAADTLTAGLHNRKTHTGEQKTHKKPTKKHEKRTFAWAQRAPTATLTLPTWLATPPSAKTRPAGR